MQTTMQQTDDRIAAKFSIKGKWAIFANIFSGIFLIAAILVIVFIFLPDEKADIPLWLIKFGGGLLIGFAALLFTSVIKIICLKLGKCGKLRVYFGLFFDVYADLPVGRNIYFLSDFVGACLCLLPLLLWCVFAWGMVSLLSLPVYLSNLFSMIPLFVFELKQPKNARLQFRQGDILALLPALPQAVTAESPDTPQ